MSHRPPLLLIWLTDFASWGRHANVLGACLQCYRMLGLEGPLDPRKLSMVTTTAPRNVLLHALTLLGLLLGMAGTSQAQTVVYYHTDALGSPVAVTDAGGVVLERREYEPFGKQLTPTLQDGPGYTGHASDAATNLSYMQQRYYDPVLGKFLSTDAVSVDTVTGSNFCRYCYASNNPYKFKDPDGRQSRDLENEYKRSGAKPPPKSPDDKLGTAIGVALGGVLAAPVAGYLGSVALASPGTANAVMTGLVDVAAGDALGGASLAAGAGATIKAGDAFFDGATLQSRVVDQIATGDNHAFPVLVDRLAAEHGTVTKVMDTRGNPVEMLTLPGAKNGESGTFEYIKNQANEIYHRFFNKD